MKAAGIAVLFIALAGSLAGCASGPGGYAKPKAIAERDAFLATQRASEYTWLNPGYCVRRCN
jgi:hypothetical protein